MYKRQRNRYFFCFYRRDRQFTATLLSSLRPQLLLSNHFICGIKLVCVLVQRTILDSAPLTSLIVGVLLAVLPDDFEEDDEFSCSSHLEFFANAWVGAPAWCAHGSAMPHTRIVLRILWRCKFFSHIAQQQLRLTAWFQTVSQHRFCYTENNVTIIQFYNILNKPARKRNK